LAGDRKFARVLKTVAKIGNQTGEFGASGGASGSFRPLEGMDRHGDRRPPSKETQDPGAGAEPTKAETNDASPPLDPTSLSYLIIDDNRFARTLIKNALYTFGARRIFEAADAMEGFDALRKEQVDVVLVDYQMPEMTGVEFTLQVRKGGETPNPEIPIIMISGYAHEENILSARQAGIHEFVSKPFSFNSLFRHIEKTVTHPRQFIRTENYAGPDRRWLDIDTPIGPERRNADEGRVAQSAARAVSAPGAT